MREKGLMKAGLWQVKSGGFVEVKTPKSGNIKREKGIK